MDEHAASEPYEEVRRLYAAGEYEKALGILAALLNRVPDSKEMLYSRGLCLLALGRMYEARLEFRKLQASYGHGPWTDLEVSMPRGDAEEESAPAPDPRRKMLWPVRAHVIALVLAALVIASIGWAFMRHRPREVESQAQTQSTSQADTINAPPNRDEDLVADSIALPALEQVLIPDKVKTADIPTLLKLLEDYKTLHASLAELRRRATAFDLDHLNYALEHSPVPHVRYCVPSVMAKIGSTTSIGPLVHAMQKSNNRWVRRESALALGRIGTDRVVEPLDTAMRTDADSSVRKYAARGLYLALGEKAIPYFQVALAQEKDPGCIQALRWLCDVEFKGTRPPAIAAGQISFGSLSDFLYEVYVPKTYSPAHRCRLLVSVHGTDGTPDAYASMCRDTADREYCVVLAPYFDAFNYPMYDGLDEDVSGVRSDQRLLQVIESLPQFANVKVDRFFLFGHSKGGQFVLRFVMAHPDRIIRAAACAFGDAIMPGSDAVFPWGLKPNATMPDLASISFMDLISAHMAVVVGSKDGNMPLAEKFVTAAEKYAQEHSGVSHVQLFVVPDGVHAGTSNFPTASKFLFGK